jgi:hypothetical protein
MLPRIEAQESLSRITDMAIAVGSMKEGERDRVLRSLQRTARGPQKPKPMTPEESLSRLLAMGAPVSTEVVKHG